MYAKLIAILFSAGSFGERVKFGCAPLDFKNQRPNSWMEMDYRALSKAKVYACYENLCNGFEIISMKGLAFAPLDET